MTENKRFIIDVGEPQHENAFFEYDEHFDDYDFVCWEDDFDEILKKFNELGNEIEQLKEQLADANELNSVYVDFLVDKGFELSDVIEWSKKELEE